MASPISWKDQSERAEEPGDYEEIQFNYTNAYPLNANLWYSPGDLRAFSDEDREPKWLLDLAWMEGGYEAGKEVLTRREETTDAMTEDEAKKWAFPFVLEVLEGNAKPNK